MAIRKIREIGDEVLTKVCKEVTKMTPRTTELIDDMLETMYEAMGVGLLHHRLEFSKESLSSISEKVRLL